MKFTKFTEGPKLVLIRCGECDNAVATDLLRTPGSLVHALAVAGMVLSAVEINGVRNCTMPLCRECANRIYGTEAAAELLAEITREVPRGS